VAKAVQEWIAAVGAKTAYIEQGSPWENGYVESFNARLRDELLDGKIFYSLREARIVIEGNRRKRRSKMTGSPAAQTNGSGRGMLLRFLVLGGLLLTSQGMAIAQDPLPYTSLKAYIVDLKASIQQKAGAGSKAFKEPPAGQLDGFRLTMQQLLLGDVTSAINGLDALNYDLNSLNDDSGKSYLVAQERSTGFRGLGTYVVDLNYARNVIVEVPHPIADENTEEEGSDIFQGLAARALFIAGTHRCANLGKKSGCSGKTTACDGSIPVRISDAPHFTRNFMYEGHSAALQLDPQPISLNLHGNKTEPVDVTLSNGTLFAGAATDLVQQLRKELLARSKSKSFVKSCNWPLDGLTERNLCGTMNAQGRLSNGSPKPCTMKATSASGLFLHIEQHQKIRDDPSLLIQALQAVLPIQPRFSR
jgi:Integrase core domain